jgi:hypothetical protein
MASVTSNRAARLEPRARTRFASRRRWMRWAAIALAVLTLLSAVSQFGRRPAVHRPAAAPTPGPLGATPVTSVPGEGGAGLRPEPERSASLVPLGGPVAEMPPGVRIVNIIVPASAASAGRLIPASHVDVLAAFDTGQERLVRRVLASALVLRVTPASGLSGAEGRFAAAPMAELSLAIPASSEREIVLAQAFGRVYVVTAPAAAPRRLGGHEAGEGYREGQTAASLEADDAGGSAADAALSMRAYLGLPSAPGPSPSLAPPPFLSPAAAFPAPVLSWPGVAAASRRRVSNAATPASGSEPPLRAGSGTSQMDGAREGAVIIGGGQVVEIIDGTARSFVEVAP